MRAKQSSLLSHSQSQVSSEQLKIQSASTQSQQQRKQLEAITEEPTIKKQESTDGSHLESFIELLRKQDQEKHVNYNESKSREESSYDEPVSELLPTPFESRKADDPGVRKESMIS